MKKKSRTMRDYKFRAKKVDTGTWVYGSLLHGRKIATATVGQYTGMKDIYEGDIVEVGISRYVVIWGKKSCGFKLKLIAKGVYRYLPISKAERVVGNIYDDTELLEVTG